MSLHRKCCCGVCPTFCNITLGPYRVRVVIAGVTPNAGYNDANGTYDIVFSNTCFTEILDSGVYIVGSSGSTYKLRLQYSTALLIEFGAPASLSSFFFRGSSGNHGGDCKSVTDGEVITADAGSLYGTGGTATITAI